MSLRWAESALSWWEEAGVDTVVGEQPRNWLATPAPAAAREVVRERHGGRWCGFGHPVGGGRGRGQPIARLLADDRVDAGLLPP